MSSHDENVVTHNPFEGKNGASMRNQAIDAGVGFGVSFLFFTIMFIIATIIDVTASH
ncbi:YqzM family protein [Lysinibacillus yapensis]|uniref:YqzM family protein n=1 Tax=Ureibacillus yapensis TaxID=2304605 RepID=A0A396SHQ8_9BACL|nr:YqzM family protein [Lysinibacillus yapensis]RHW38607.1 YqzM family protein [Lysinibacillus yapensis]